ncbi:MAG: SGNH/GDSL hydrolase family protein [Desulfobaccales bacterium]
MRRWLEKLLLFLLGAIFALVMVEGGLRLFGIEYPHFYEFDPVLGGRLRPGVEGYWLKEGRGYVSINSDSMRDREHAVAKPPNTLRIAVLGDSFAEALQVDQEEAFWAIMEKQLQGCENLKGRNIEVLNFGQSGFGTTQELLALRHRAWKYSPDIILLTFCTGNDMADNSPILNQRYTDPFFVRREGQLILDDSRTKREEKIRLAYEQNRNWLGHLHIWVWQTSNLRILQVIQHVKHVAGEWWPEKSPEGMAGSVSQGLAGAGMFIDIYRKPSDEAWKEAWQLTEAVLLKMRDEVVQKGARLYVVVLTNAIQVSPDAGVRDILANYPGVEDVFYPDRRLERFCSAHGIPVLLLGPPFKEYAIKHQVYLHGFKELFRDTLGNGHWNENGHRLAGQLLAQWLCPQLP